MQIEDPVFVVTGASSGIGAATAAALAARGGKVALLSRSAEALAAPPNCRAAWRSPPT